MGETISVSTMLAEVIESQVKVVDGRRPDVAERWFTPEPRAVNRSAWSDWQRTQHSTTGAAGAQHHQQAEPAYAEHAAASHSAEGGINGSSAAPRAWSDDFSSVMVVDYRPKPGSHSAEPAATSLASSVSDTTVNGTAVNGYVNGTAVNGAAVKGHVNGTAVNGAAVNGHVNGTPVDSMQVNGTQANGSSEAGGLNSNAAAPVNGTAHSSSSSSSSPAPSFADWAGVSGALSGSSSAAQDVPFADWAGDGQPVYEEVLDKRLTGIEDQLQRIAGLLEMMPKSQQLAQLAQQAQQASLRLEQEGEKASNAV